MRLCQSESPRLNSHPIKLRYEYNVAHFYHRPSLLANKSLSCNCRAPRLNMSIIRLLPSCLLENMLSARCRERAFAQIASLHYTHKIALVAQATFIEVSLFIGACRAISPEERSSYWHLELLTLYCYQSCFDSTYSVTLANLLFANKSTRNNSVTRDN